MRTQVSSIRALEWMINVRALIECLLDCYFINLKVFFSI